MTKSPVFRAEHLRHRRYPRVRRSGHALAFLETQVEKFEDTEDTLGLSDADLEAVEGKQAGADFDYEDVPEDQDTLLLGKDTYTFDSLLGEDANHVLIEAVGVPSQQTLTLTGVTIADGDTLAIDDRTYTFVDALTEVKASGVLTLTENAADDNTVTIGATVYRFKNTPAQAFDVDIGVDASGSIDNLIAAINAGPGSGTAYFAGTTAHPDVVAATGGGDTMNVTAKVPGVAGNSIATTDTLAGTSAFGAATLASGVDPVADEIVLSVTATVNATRVANAVNADAETEGVEYSTGTTAHASFTAQAVGSTVEFASPNGHETANTLVFATDITGATFDEDGSDGEGGYTGFGGVDPDTMTYDNLVAAVTGGDGEGEVYSTGTVAHPLVTATHVPGDNQVQFRAIEEGEAGNDIVMEEDVANASFAGGDGTFAQGVTEVVSGSIAEGEHGFEDGEGPYIAVWDDEATEMPEGFPAAGTLLYVHAIDADHFGLASTPELAVAGNILQFTSPGDGAWTLQRAADGGAVFEAIKRHGARTIASLEDIDDLADIQ